MSGGIEVPNRYLLNLPSVQMASKVCCMSGSSACKSLHLSRHPQAALWMHGLAEVMSKADVVLLCRGQVRFYKKGPKACTVKLTITYEVPGPLVPFASVSDVASLFFVFHAVSSRVVLYTFRRDGAL